MVHYEIQIGEKERDVVKEIALSDSANVKKRKYARIIFGILSLMEGIFAVDAIRKAQFGSGFFMLVFAVICVLLCFGVKKYQKFFLNRSEKKQDPDLLYGSREYFFDEDGVKVVSKMGTGENHWKAFACWGIYQNYIYLKRKDRQMILVDQTKLSSDERTELKGFLRQVQEG